MNQLPPEEKPLPNALHVSPRVSNWVGKGMIVATVIGGPSVASGNLLTQNSDGLIGTISALSEPSTVTVTHTTTHTATVAPTAGTPAFQESFPSASPTRESGCPGPIDASTMNYMGRIILTGDNSISDELFEKVGTNPNINEVVASTIEAVNATNSPWKATSAISELTQTEFGFPTTLEIAPDDVKNYLDVPAYKTSLANFASYIKLFPANTLRDADVRSFRITDIMQWTGHDLGTYNYDKHEMSININYLDDPGVFAHEIGHALHGKICNDYIGDKDFGINMFNPNDFAYGNTDRPNSERAFYRPYGQKNVLEDAAEIARGILTDNRVIAKNVEQHTLLGLKAETMLARVDALAPGSAKFIVANSELLGSIGPLNQRDPRPYTAPLQVAHQ